MQNLVYVENGCPPTVFRKILIDIEKIALMFLFQYDVGNLVHNSKKNSKSFTKLGKNNPIF